MARLTAFLMSICVLVELILISSSHVRPLCQNRKHQALVRFKDNFIIDNTTIGFAYPKTKKWEEFQGVDCCFWQGVECDLVTGHVIGLDLSSSGLHGSIDPNSSLFSLVHLQNFQFQFFFHFAATGKLFKTGESLLQIERPRGLERLIQNCTNLQYFRLSGVKIDSNVPHILANFSKLRHLKLVNCGLRGHFPEFVFQLPSLQVLYSRNNPSLTGCLPEFHSSMPLKELVVGKTLFYGKIPASLGNLDSLQLFEAEYCNFWGIIPTSLQNLTHLTFFAITHNSFSGKAPAFLSNATQLKVLSLGFNKFGSGEIPSSFANLMQLQTLDLRSNSFCGHFPPWITNLRQLASLDISYNMLHGGIPSSISRLKNLEIFSAEFNKLRDIELDTFLELKHKHLFFSGNSLLVHGKDDTSHKDAPSLLHLQLGNCNLTKFPDFLEGQDQLEVLGLSKNNIHGEHSQQFCNWSSLGILDISYNKLSGTIPECLANSSIYLEILNLQGNNFHGTIPQTWTSGNTIKLIALGQNKLVGRVPRSLIHCKMLELLDLGGTELRGGFPSWSASLPELKVLILSSNKFYGGIKHPKQNSTFPKLRILDLSSNKFSGALPAIYFENLVAMKVEHYSEHLTYLQLSYSANSAYDYTYPYSITLVNKDKRLDYRKIPEVFAAIDLSCNKFEGRIPESIGLLGGLLVLNLSNNFFSGYIPSSLANLMKLEALDLSQNKLVGQIPLQLRELNFLEVFNVSHNKLAGPIPQGKQFDAFPNNSFHGNPGLCGSLLTKHCKDTDHEVGHPSHSANDNDSEATGEIIAWEGVALGYGIGFLLGLLFAQRMIRGRMCRLLKHNRGT